MARLEGGPLGGGGAQGGAYPQGMDAGGSGTGGCSPPRGTTTRHMTRTRTRTVAQQVLAACRPSVYYSTERHA